MDGLGGKKKKRKKGTVPRRQRGPRDSKKIGNTLQFVLSELSRKMEGKN